MTENTNSLTRATGTEWTKFLKFLTLGAGAGFLLSGIIFFFAYNWSEMHRFTKMGIVGAIMLACYGGVFLAKKNELVQKILITSMSVIVGIMLALYGQIYQLEADSYMMFLTWGIAILVWAIVADFYPLWMIVTTLFSVAIIQYFTSKLFFVSLKGMSCIGPFFLISVVGIFWSLPLIIKDRKPAPAWFMSILLTATLVWAFTLVCFDLSSNILVYLVALVMMFFYATREKNIWVYSMFFLGLILLYIRLFVNERMFHDDGVRFLFLSASIIAALFYITKHLMDKYKEWYKKDGNK